MASEARARRGHRGAIRGRHRGGLSQQSGCRTVPGGTYGTNAKVQPGTASRENAPAGIWSVCDRPTAVAWRRETGNVQLSWLYAHLREEEEQWTVHGVAANDPQKIADEAERGESRTSAAEARTHPRTGQMAASGGAWTHPVLRSAPEPKCAVDFSVPSGRALASRAFAAQPERPRPLGSHAAPHHSLAASAYRLSSLSPAPHGRHHLRQEPDAGIPLVRSRGRGDERSSVLLRLFFVMHVRLHWATWRDENRSVGGAQLDERIADTLVPVGIAGRLANSDQTSNSHRVIDRGL